jgi:hypothetical protein
VNRLSNFVDMPTLHPNRNRYVFIDYHFSIPQISAIVIKMPTLIATFRADNSQHNTVMNYDVAAKHSIESCTMAAIENKFIMPENIENFPQLISRFVHLLFL